MKNCREYWNEGVNPKLKNDIDKDTRKLFKKTECKENFKIFHENLKNNAVFKESIENIRKEAASKDTQTKKNDQEKEKKNWIVLQQM